MDGGDMIMITISDIARETGLSTATVSNALSGKGRVSDARRKQIIEVATRMGYDFSRIRVAQPHRGIAVIVETLSVTFCTKIAEGICRAAEDGGYQVKLYNLDIIHNPEDFNPPRGADALAAGATAAPAGRGDAGRLPRHRRGGPAHPPGYRLRGLRQLRLRRLRLPHPDHDRPAPGTDREYSLSSIEKRDREAKCRGKKPASRCPAGPPTVRIDHTR